LDDDIESGATMSTSEVPHSSAAKGALSSSSPSLHDFETSETVTPMEMSVDETLPGVGRSADFARDLGPGETDAHSTDSMLGQTLGSYKLTGILGEGGMGRVYLAEHTKIGRQVALKMLHTHLARSPDVVRRFFDEARAVNQILHDNIVEITDFIENEDGNNYFIMEYLRGTSLSSVVSNPKEKLSLTRALDIGIQVTSALGAVHKSSIVHRDLKPENIFLTERGGRKDFVKLLDFGIAKLIGDADSGINLQETEAGVIMGTPDYMSPQQACATKVDHRTDIYSLGVILYEMCTRELPFKAKDFGDLIVMHKTKSPVAPNLLQPIPGPLNELILHCLEKEPEDRPQTCAEIEERLRTISENAGGEFDTAVLAPKPERTASQSNALKIGAALVGVAAVAVLLFVLISGDKVKGTGDAKPSKRAEVAEKADPATSAPKGPAVPTPDLIVLSFQSEPPGAQVFSTGESQTLLGVTPLDLSLERLDEDVEFELRKEGFEPLSQRIRLDRGGRIQVALLPLGPVVKVPAVVSKRKTSRKSNSKKPSETEVATEAKAKATDPAGETSTTNSKTMYKEGAVMNPFGKK